VTVVTYQILARPKRMLQVEPFEAKAMELKGGKKADRAYYNYTFMLDEADPDTAAMIKIAKELLAEVAKNRKVDLKNLQAGRDFSWPFQAGSEVAAKAVAKMAAAGKGPTSERPYADKILLNANTPADAPIPTVLFIPQNDEFVPADPIAAKASRLFYRGMNALGVVAFISFDMGVIWGVTCMVNELVATGTGDRFSGQADGSKYGKPTVEGRITNIDPLQF